MVALQRAKEVGSVGDILKGAGPSSSFVIQAPILDVPGRDTGFCQSRGQRPHVIHRDGAWVQTSKLRNPAATVHDNRDRVWALRGRHAQLAELQWVCPINYSPRLTRNLGSRQIERISALRGNGAGQQRNNEYRLDLHVASDLPVYFCILICARNIAS
jgi:hypothetical protein